MTQYHCKCLTTEPDDLIAYWPLWEASGEVMAEDISGHNSHGRYTAVALGQPGIGDGKTCPLFNGATSYVNIYTAELERNFDPEEFTVSAWIKVANDAVWSDATFRTFFIILGDAGGNYIHLQKINVAGRLHHLFYAGGAGINLISNNNQGVYFIHQAVTVSLSGNYVRFYQRGNLAASGVYPGAWVPTTLFTNWCSIGAAYNPTPTEPWNGYIAHVILWKKALSAAQVKYISRYW